MKIGIVLHPFSETNKSGLSVYAWNVTKNIIEQDKNINNNYLIFVKSNKKPLLKINSSNWSVVNINKKYFWLDRGLYGYNLDTLILMTPVVPWFLSFNKIIVVIHDLGYRYIKASGFKNKLFQLLSPIIFGYAVRKTDHLVVNSVTTKYEVIKYLNTNENKIKIINPGFSDVKDIKKTNFELPDNFFLFVGVIKARKNVLNLVKAFAKFKEVDKKNFKLILVGRKAGFYYQQIFDFVKDNGLDQEVIFTDYLEDEEINYLYQKAYAFVFISFLEGFGMSVLDAVHNRLPCVLSDIPVFRELFTNVSIFSKPDDLEDISNSLFKIVDDSNLYKSLKVNCCEFDRFSWSNSGKLFLDIINYERK